MRPQRCESEPAPYFQGMTDFSFIYSISLCICKVIYIYIHVHMYIHIICIFLYSFLSRWIWQAATLYVTDSFVVSMCSGKGTPASARLPCCMLIKRWVGIWILSQKQPKGYVYLIPKAVFKYLLLGNEAQLIASFSFSWFDPTDSSTPGPDGNSILSGHVDGSIYRFHFETETAAWTGVVQLVEECFVFFHWFWVGNWRNCFKWIVLWRNMLRIW